MIEPTTTGEVVVCALYKFVQLDNFAQLRSPLCKTLTLNAVKGTLLLANEGVNGTIAGPKAGVQAVLNFLEKDPRLAPISYKLSYTDQNPFHRSKVKLKREIVTLGVEGIDPRHTVGTYVKPKDWNALIEDPEVVLIDTRNDYEVEIGTFKGALNPKTQSFREFPAYVSEQLDPKRHKKVAMFCTGGIRCEKSTAYLKEQGFDEVYHLEGGILQYLEEVPESDSLWQGECFVFDGRVAVNHNLEPGQYDQCYACRYPLTEQDKQHPDYQQGVSCARCIEQTTHEQRRRFAERERQIQLARQRGEAHIGGEIPTLISQRKAKKYAEREASREQTRHNNTG